MCKCKIYSEIIKNKIRTLERKYEENENTKENNI